ncbi:MAG: hypothetical protein H0V44_15160 [Planctomycetes bacterium]|nr:hypothetical protein [Planctomycetota bacterium]
MKRLGCIVGSLGLMLLIGSIFLFGAAIFGLANPHEEDMAYPIALESLEPIAVRGLSTGSERRLACRLEISTRQAERIGPGPAVEHRFRFPLAYVVRGSDKHVLAQGDGAVAWDANDRRTLSTGSAAAPDVVVAEQSFTVCGIPADGSLSVTLLIRPDETFNATYTHAWLVVHDNRQTTGHLALVGAVLLVLGPACLVAGAGIFVWSFFKRRTPRSRAASAPEPASDSDLPAANEATTASEPVASPAAEASQPGSPPPTEQTEPPADSGPR